MAMSNGTDSFCSLFDGNLLKELDFSKASVHLKNGLSSKFCGDNLSMRPLNNKDFEKGYMKLLAQLTTIGNVDREKFVDTFYNMKHCRDVYYIVAIEDEIDNKIVACGTLVIEQKFIHGAAKRGRIEDIVVDEDYRSKKLGKLLVETLTLLSVKVGCYKTSLECKDPLVGFYTQFGYKKEDQQNYVCQRFFN